MSYKREPKPFAFVDIKGVPKKEKFVSLEKLEKTNLTGIMELKFEVVSDFFFVGSGGYDYSKAKNLVYYTFFKSGDKVAIPGSSLKGAIRSVAEAISNSCVSVVASKKGEKPPRSHERCKFELEKGIETLCPSCNLFGTTGYCGRVSFSDASPTKYEVEIVKIYDLFKPNNVWPKRKFYQNKQFNPIGNLKPEKNYRFIEAIKKGSAFNTEMTFFNVKKEELSLLLYAMGIKQDYKIKIGGAKPRCLGTVKFTPTRLFKLKENNPLDYEEKTQQELESFISEILKKDTLIEKSLLEQFKNEMSERSELCPKEVY